MDHRFDKMKKDLHKLKISTRRVPFRLKFGTPIVCTLILLKAIQSFAPAIPQDIPLQKSPAKQQVMVHDLLARSMTWKHGLVHHLQSLYNFLHGQYLTTKQQKEASKELLDFMVKQMVRIENEILGFLARGELLKARTDIDDLKVLINALIEASGTKHDELQDLIKRLNHHYDEAVKRYRV